MFSGSTTRQPETVCVLDIGSNKVVCLIGREEPGLGVRLIGSGFGVSSGLKGGAVVDLEAAEVGIRAAVEKAGSLCRFVRFFREDGKVVFVALKEILHSEGSNYAS